MYMVDEMQNGVYVIEDRMEIPQKFAKRTTQQYHLWVYMQIIEIRMSKYVLALPFFVVFKIAKMQKQDKCPSVIKWINK